MRNLISAAVRLAVLISCTVASAAAEPERPKQVAILAYINQTSGCQEATEEFLGKLTVEHKGRVTLEIVDFGGEGKQRWRRDGMKCMCIALNGRTEARIVDRGLTLDVKFVMPAGHNWTHEDLAIAVRQALYGVDENDRRSPDVKAVSGDDGTAVVIGGDEVLVLPRAGRARALVEALRKAGGDGLAREDFAGYQEGDGSVLISAKGQELLRLTAADAAREGTSVRDLALVWCGRIAGAYPIRIRPIKKSKANPSER